MPSVVIVDVDDTVADFVPSWVREFLRQYPHCPDPREHWQDWDISPHVHESFRDQFWRTLDEPTLYDQVEPIPGALEGIELLRKYAIRIVFATSATNGHAGVKLRWLVRHNFLDTVIRQKDYIETFDKSLIRGHLIIDDRPKTCRDFAAVNGGRRSALLYLRPPHLDRQYRLGLIDVAKWSDIPAKVGWMLNQ